MSHAQPSDFDSFDAHLDEEAIERLEQGYERDENETIDDDYASELDELLAMGETSPAGPGADGDQGSPKLADSEQRYEGPDRRNSVLDTRASGLERRRGPGRRLTDFVKAAEEGEMNAEQFLFLKAIETFKAANNKHYPNWTDVLEVVRLLGYRKTLESELNLPGASDWTEKADADANVRTRQGVHHKRKKAA